MLFDKYRPTEWSDLIGQDKAAGIARRLIERETFDRGAFWIECGGQNNSGVGKSSLANVIANQLADDWMTTNLSGAECDKPAVKRLESTAQLTAMSADKPYRVWIIDEAHAISDGAVDLFLTFLERLPRHCVIIFTTTRAVDEGLFGDDAGPFASRTIRLMLTNQGLAKPFAARVREIATAEGLNGRPMSEYVRLLKDCKNNFRQALQRVEAGEMLAGGAS